jgi:hypothetical protein
LPGSGWCHHPQRKVSSDVKILVRRSELACRDDWSRSLWQPATGASGADAAPMHPPDSGPVLPASQESLRAVLNRDLTVAASTGEDVLLSEGRIVSERQEPWGPPSRPFPAGNFDPRTALFKAREAYREKIRAIAMASRQSSVEANAGAFDRSENESDDEATAGGEPGSGALGRARAETARDEGPPRDRTAAVPAPSGMVASATLAESWAGEPEPVATPLYRGPETPEVDEKAVAATRREAEVCAPELPATIQDETFSLEAQSTMLATELPEWFRADLPRVCRACRDFRPATEGQRGWCANAWAFTHRQLVQEDDVAPCHSAIGDWWVAVDDVWLVAADVSSHGRATPLLDRMIGAESGQRRRS